MCRLAWRWSYKGAKMYEAHSLKSITEQISSVLPRKIYYTKREKVPSNSIGLMTTTSMNLPTNYETINIEEEKNSKLIGFLFSHPKTSLAKSEIIDHLAQFHIRSGDAIDFFCVGYGAYWPPEHFADQNPVTTIEGVDWLFSEIAFSGIIDDLENVSKWEYSGETELILVTAVKRKTGEVIIDYRNAIVCNLEAMAKDNAFTSVRSFFEGLFKYAKKNSAENPAWDYSDEAGIGIANSAVKDAIISLLPEKLKDAYQKVNHYAIRDISK